MARQANGNYLQPANTAAVAATTINSSAFNTLITDIGTEITNSVDRAGRSAMTANLPMGANKITGMAEPTVTTDATTKNYVDTTTASFFSTGDVKLTIKTVADTGWVLFDDGTIGSATSGASSYANALAQPLFNLIFNNISDTYAPILTSGGGATTRAAQTNAATAWAANCRISLPKALGRALAVSGSGSGLTARTLGQTAGAETIGLVTANLPPYTPVVTSATTQIPVYNNTNTAGSTVSNAVALGNAGNVSAGLFNPASGGGGTTVVMAAQGGTSTAFSIMQPTTFLNAMIKI